MKVCFPVEANNGLESNVYGHFGSAPVFVVFNTETEKVATIANQDLGHEHGMCNPVQALNGQMVDAIVVGGIGGGAINKLNQMGIKVYKAVEGSIAVNIKLFKEDKLSEMNASHACGGHAGACNH